MTDRAFCNMDSTGRQHVSASKVWETVVSVIVTATLTMLVTSQVTKYQIEQAIHKNEKQDEEFVRLTREVVDLQKQLISLQKDQAVQQKQSDEQRQQILELLKARR